MNMTYATPTKLINKCLNYLFIDNISVCKTYVIKFVHYSYHYSNNICFYFYFIRSRYKLVLMKVKFEPKSLI